MMRRKIVFVSGTRADYGKVRSLIERAVEDSTFFDVSIFVTGMHMLPEYGSTVHEILKDGLAETYLFNNVSGGGGMDIALANTISGFSQYVKQRSPDLIVVHGDRPEPLAAAIVGVFNNIRVAHVEGGELSGTVDGLIRHSVSKLAHAHFVSTDEARDRLIKMGERNKSIFVIGAPSIDRMLSGDLPDLADVLEHYQIPFSTYAIFVFHPVTSELSLLEEKTSEVVRALEASGLNFIVIYPNNDLGTDKIKKVLGRLVGNPKFVVARSMRFDSYLTLLKNASFIIGNSSSGLCEAPVYGVPTINIGSRQQGRLMGPSVVNVREEWSLIFEQIKKVMHNQKRFPVSSDYGKGESDVKFVRCLKTTEFWRIPFQKEFVDRS